MKKLIFILLIALIGLSGRINAQSGVSCDSVKVFTSTITNFNNNYLVGNEMWFKFVGDSTKTFIFLKENQDTTVGHVRKMELYTGTCGYLSLVDTSKINDSSIVYLKENNIVYGQTYYIKAIKETGTTCYRSLMNGANFNIELFKEKDGCPDGCCICGTTSCGAHIVNGNFEANSHLSDPVGSHGYLFPFSSNRVNCWAGCAGSPELGTGHASTTTGNHTIGGNFYARMYAGVVEPTEIDGQGIFTFLQTPLIHRHWYVLDYWLRTDPNDPSQGSNSVNFLAILTQAGHNNFNIDPDFNVYTYSDIPQPDIGHFLPIHAPSNVNSSNWKEYHKCFQVDDNDYCIVYFFPYIVSGNLGITGMIDMDDVQISDITTADAGIDRTIICSQSVQIGPSVCPPPPGATISWAPSNGLSCNGCPNPIASPTITTTYTLTLNYSNSETDNCFFSTDQVTVYVNPITVDAGLDQTICKGDNIQLSATSNGIGSYNWSPSTGLNSASVPNPIANVNNSITYTVSITGGNGNCNASDQVTIYSIDNNSMACCLEHNNQWDISSYTANINDGFSQSSTQFWTPHSNPFLYLHNLAHPGSLLLTMSDVTVSDAIIIPAGMKITIQGMRFYFRPRSYTPNGNLMNYGARVIVEKLSFSPLLPAGKLILDMGTKFDYYNGCGDGMWEGAEVWGYSGAVQNPNIQGEIIIKNNSQINNAIYGVTLGKKNNFLVDNSGMYNGGIIVCPSNGAANTKSYFNDNYIDVYFPKYNTANSVSYFQYTEFKTNNLLKDNHYYPQAHAELYDVKNIRFYRCLFDNNTLPTVYNPLMSLGSMKWNPLIGIESYQSTFYCIPEASTSTIGNKFHNLRFGIYATYADATKTMTCDYGSFDNNYRGIYLAGAQLTPTIIRNHFYLIPYTNTLSNYRAYGVYLNGCTGYKVEENDFSTNNWATNTTGIGVIVNNSGAAYNEIYKNTFGNLYAGIQTQGSNASQSGTTPNPRNYIGLELRCNTFYTDIVAMDMGNTSGYIDYNQGVSGFPIGNQLSHSHTSFSNELDVINWTLTSNARIHYVCNNDVAHRPEITFCSQTPAVIVAPTSGAFDASTQCLSRFSDFHVAKSVSFLDSIITNTNRLLDTLKMRYAADSTNQDLLDSINYFSSRIAINQNDLVRRKINDNTGLNMNDTIIIDMNDFKDDGNKDDLLANLYIEKEDYTKADSVINLLQTNTDKENLVKVLQIYKYLKQNGLFVENIANDSIMKNTLYQVANDSTKEGYAFALSVLQKLFDKMYIEPIDDIIPEQEKRMNLPEVAKIKSSYFICYPNPASESINFKYLLPNGSGQGVLKIYSPLGQIIKTIEISKAEGMETLKLNAIADGLYYYTLSVNDTIIEKNKFVVNK